MAAEFVLTYMSGDRARWARQFQDEMADIDRRSSAAAILEKGMEKGMEKGRAEGRAEGRTEAMLELVKSKLLSAAEAARRLNMSESELKKLLEEN